MFAFLFTSLQPQCVLCRTQVYPFLSWVLTETVNSKLTEVVRYPKKNHGGARRVVTLPVLNLNASGVRIHQEEMWVVGLGVLFVGCFCLHFSSERLSSSCKNCSRNDNFEKNSLYGWGWNVKWRHLFSLLTRMKVQHSIQIYSIVSLNCSSFFIVSIGYWTNPIAPLQYPDWGIQNPKRNNSAHLKWLHDSRCGKHGIKVQPSVSKMDASPYSSSLILTNVTRHILYTLLTPTVQENTYLHMTCSKCTLHVTFDLGHVTSRDQNGALYNLL